MADRTYIDLNSTPSAMAMCVPTMESAGFLGRSASALRVTAPDSSITSLHAASLRPRGSQVGDVPARDMSRKPRRQSTEHTEPLAVVLWVQAMVLPALPWRDVPIWFVLVLGVLSFVFRWPLDGVNVACIYPYPC